jgi:hypothetical protein
LFSTDLTPGRVLATLSAAQGLLRRAQHHRKHQVEGAVKSADRVGNTPRALGDRGGDPRVSELQEQRAARSEKDRRS